MTNMKCICVICFVLILIVSSCSKVRDNRQSANAEDPISVIEDKNVDKTGEIELTTQDIEKARKHIYELTRKYNGYIFYERSSTNSNYETQMHITIALHNDVFLDYFNEARLYGTLTMSEIRASLASSVSDYDPSQVTMGTAQKKRSSSISIRLNTKTNIKTCLTTTVNGLNNVLYSIAPGIIILYIVALLCTILFLITYVFYHFTIKKIYLLIIKKIPKS